MLRSRLLDMPLANLCADKQGGSTNGVKLIMELTFPQGFVALVFVALDIMVARREDFQYFKNIRKPKRKSSGQG